MTAKKIISLCSGAVIALVMFIGALQTIEFHIDNNTVPFQAYLIIIGCIAYALYLMHFSKDDWKISDENL